ncbi:MAG: hypothetical protein D6713_05130 [Deltaproteobacteria bacterium]|nr:MAG: hypothetical protein D6713_05130 [Deltaproteobacteria bacterium]
MRNCRVYRFTSRAKLEDLVRVLVEGDIGGETIEEISHDMLRFGDRVVGPVMDILEKTNDDETFYRLTYLIECLQEPAFVRPLMKLLFTKRLKPALRGQLINVLNSFDVDISDTLLGSGPVGPRETAEKFADLALRDENFLETFLAEFQASDLEHQLKMVNRIGALKSPRAVFLLFLIGSMRRSPSSVQAVMQLGRIRDGIALSALRRLVTRTGEEEVRKQALRSIRRLELLGVKRERRFFSFPEGPIYRVLVSRIDGMGEYTVTVSRFYDERKNRLAMSIFHINENLGLIECYGNFRSTRKNFDSSVSGLVKARVSLDVPYEYGVSLIRHGLYLTELQGGAYPAEMPLREQIFSPRELYPERHVFEIPGFSEEEVRDDLTLLEKTDRLIDVPECSEWVISSRKTFDYAEEIFRAGDPISDEILREPRRRNLLRKFIRECVYPLRETIRERLLFTAELMEKGKRSRRHVRAVLCAALNIGEEGNISFSHHPFIEALARESLKEAAEYLREGADYRGFLDDFEDE